MLAEDRELEREYRCLLKEGFGQLAQAEQGRVLALIERGTARLRTNDLGEESAKRWRRDLLAQISSHLTGRMKELYDSLVVALGPATERVYSDISVHTGWRGAGSSKGADDLEGSISVHHLGAATELDDSFCGLGDRI